MFYFKPQILGLIAALALSTTAAFAQPKVTRLIVPYAAGGPIDVTARLLAER
ncbi:MAG: tripartite tricarboxylate transporter substrate binding protein, partial [Polaromonas sp.]